MKVFHTIYTMTIGQFSEMLESEDITMVKRVNIWVPKWLLVRKYRQLLTDFNLQSAEKQVKRLITKDLSKLSVLNQINIQAPILLELYRIFEQTKEKDVENLLKENYLMFTGKKMQEPDKDMKAYIDHIKLLAKKYEQVFHEEETDSKGQFEEALTRLEMILAPVDVRGKKLFTYRRYVELANEKMQQLKN